MAVDATYKLHAIDFNGTVLGGIEDDEISLDSLLRSEAYGGDVFSHRTSLAAQNPGVRFTTFQIAQAFTILTPASGPYASDDEHRLFPIGIASLTPNFVSLYGQKFAEAVAASGSVHLKYLIREGAAYWTGLRCTHQDDVRLTVEMAPTYDGTNDPVVKTRNVALPTNPAEQCFTLGPIQVAGIRMRTFRELDIRSGVRCDREGGESDIWPTLANAGAILPEMTLMGIDPDWLDDSGISTIPITGLDCNHTDTIVYLRRRAQGGTYVADGTAQHVKLTFNGQVVPDTVFRRRVTQAGETGLMIKCNLDADATPDDPPIKIEPNVVIDTTGWPA